MQDPTFALHVQCVLAGLPAPPLPLAPIGRDDDEDGAERAKGLASSHDLLHRMVVVAAMHGNERMHAARRERQQACTAELMRGIRHAGDAAAAYRCFQDFTAAYLRGFACDEGAETPFLPMDAVAIGSSVHEAACGWSAGQDSLHLPEERRRTRSEYAKCTYGDIVDAARLLLVAMSP